MVKNKKMKLGWLEQSDASAVKLDTSGLLGESEKSPITAFEQWLRRQEAA